MATHDIASICQRHLVTIGRDDTLQDAALRMREQHVGALVVTAGDGAAMQVVGVLTDRDLVIESLARGGDVSQRRVRELTLAAPVSVPQEAGLLQAAERMAAAGVRRLLVEGIHREERRGSRGIALFPGVAVSLQPAVERVVIERRLAAPAAGHDQRQAGQNGAFMRHVDALPWCILSQTECPRFPCA